MGNPLHDRRIVAAVALAWACLIGFAVVNSQVAATVPDRTPEIGPLFRDGQRIGVIWECPWPVAPGPDLPACYGEVLSIVRVRADGWLDVIDSGQLAWTVNPTRMIGFRVLEATQVAVR